jgi:hypothetical protein
MATGTPDLVLRQQKGKRLLGERIEGVETEQRDDGELAVIDSATEVWLASLGPCEEAAEPDLDLPFPDPRRIPDGRDGDGRGETGAD